MPSNDEIAEQFEEIADRMLLEGDSWFKVSAYQRAAKTFRGMSESLEDISSRGRLRKVPGVGDAIATKIDAFLHTGQIPLLERLRAEQPLGQLDLMRQTRLTPRRVRALAASPLHIRTIDELREALATADLLGSGALDAEGLKTARDWAARGASAARLSR
jgi:DNA polymerase (family 10)